MSPHESEPTTFGIVAGLGMGAGIFYYRSLVNAQLARGLSPRILMVHADVRRVMAHAAARETRLLATYLAGLLRQLAEGGAQLATIPCFLTSDLRAGAGGDDSGSARESPRCDRRRSRAAQPSTSLDLRGTRHHGN